MIESKRNTTYNSINTKTNMMIDIEEKYNPSFR